MKKIILILVVLLASQLSAAEISIDMNASSGIWFDYLQYKIIPICETKLAVRFNNTGGILEGGMTNGFKIWSPGGGTFDTVYATLNENYQWSSFPDPGGFFDSYEPVYFSCDGIGADTIGMGGVAAFFGTGFPADFNDIAFYIHIEGFSEGQEICIDSSWFPPAGPWKWGSSGVIPEWGGPYCFVGATPSCLEPIFDPSTPDTITIVDCGTTSFQFIGIDNPLADPGMPIYYALENGFGTIDKHTGLWTIDIDKADDGQEYHLDVIVYTSAACMGTNKSVTIIVDIQDQPGSFDANDDCSSDISDLVCLIDYMFNDDPEPPRIDLGDCDGIEGFDVADIVYLVDYMFNDGPPPDGM